MKLLQYFHLSGPLASGTISFYCRELCHCRHSLFLVAEHQGRCRNPAKKLCRSMKLVTVMVVMLIVWCGYTIAVRHSPLPPWPYPRNLRLTTSALGWLAHSSLPHTFGVLAVLMPSAIPFLAMSGEESLAQVYREIESPKLPNLKKAGAVIFVYSFGSLPLWSRLCRDDYSGRRPPAFPREPDWAGLAMNLEGPFIVRLIFHGCCSCGGHFDPGGRGQHGHRRLEWECLNRVSERRRAERLVPSAAQTVWYQLSHHQHRRGAASHHYHHQSR